MIRLWAGSKTSVVAQQQEFILNTVSGNATDCSGTKAERATKLRNNAYKGKRGTYLSDLEQCVHRQKGSTDLVTGIDISATGSRNFDGDLTLGTFSRSRFS